MITASLSLYDTGHSFLDRLFLPSRPQSGTFSVATAHTAHVLRNARSRSPLRCWHAAALLGPLLRPKGTDGQWPVADLGTRASWQTRTSRVSSRDDTSAGVSSPTFCFPHTSLDSTSPMSSFTVSGPACRNLTS